jgi:hypothetical protein
LAPADAARFVIAFERLRQDEWGLITQTANAQPILRWGHTEEHQLPFGRPGEHIVAARITLNKQMSRIITRRLRSDRTCRTSVLRAAAQALLDDDLELSKGLLRRLVDATLGFEALADLVEGHPKSLIRMLSPNGNPAARQLVAVMARLAQWHGVRLTVT